MNKKIELTVSEELFEKIEKKALSSGNKDINGYVISIIEDNLKKDYSQEYEENEKEMIKKRLKDLGYLE